MPSGRRALTEQGYPRTQPDYPGRRGRSGTPQEPRRSGWQVLDAFDAGGDSEADLPPWAGPGVLESTRTARRPSATADPDESSSVAEPEQDRSPRRGRGPGRSRAAATRRRRSRRRLAIVGVAAMVVVVVVLAVEFLRQSAPVTGGLINSLQKGEYG